MLRIHHRIREGEPCLVLEGKLVGPWVEECRELLAANEAARPALDARDVHYADAAGAALLAELDSAGRIRARSPYLSALLVREETMRPESLPRTARDDSPPLHPSEGRSQRLARLYSFATRLLDDDALAQELTRRAFLEAPDAEPRELHRRLVTSARACLTHPSAWTTIEPLLPVFVGRGAHVVAVPEFPSSPVPAEVLLAAQRALPALHRAVLQLCDGEGLTPAECARWLALSEAEVRSARHQARQALVTLLRREAVQAG
ncbi:MAG: sigma factor-like helix-turn-helix DNA-binding protein [Planctomycetota bacterium]